MPPPYYATIPNILLSGLRADQPAATDVGIGWLYAVTDENFLIEQSDGATWSQWGPTPGGGANAVTAAGTLTSGEPVLGAGSKAVAVGPINLAGGATHVTGDLPLANLAQGSALSVLGVTGNATADNASIAAASDHQVMRRSGTSVAFGAVNLAQAAAITGTLPIANGGTGSTSAPLIHTATFTLTNDEIKALPTTYKELVAAPGATKILQFHWCQMMIDAGAGAYTNVDAGDEQGIAVAGGDWIVDCSDFFAWNGNGGAIQLVPFQSTVAAGYPSVGTQQNGNQALKLIAWNDPGDYTGGNAANAGRGTIAYSIWDYITNTYS